LIIVQGLSIKKISYNLAPKINVMLLTKLSPSPF
jgi:hypothetical protein